MPSSKGRWSRRRARPGALYTSIGEGRIAFVSREDCAAAAAAVLMQDGHEGQAYDITGPEAIGAADLAALAGAEVVPVDDDAVIAGMIAAGIPERRARVLTSIHRAGREGFLGNVTSAVQDLTGTAPRSLRDVLS